MTSTKFNCRETETQIIWHVEQETPLHRMVTDVTCEKKDMLLINYEAPDGAKRHNRLPERFQNSGRLRWRPKAGSLGFPYRPPYAFSICVPVFPFLFRRHAELP